MDTIDREFDIKLKKVFHAPDTRTDMRFARLPRIRRYLLLAFQIDRLIENDPDLSLYKIADWLGWSYTHVKQIANLIYLCPKIQKELLLGDTDKISRFSESSLRPVTKEVNWQNQLSLWQDLLNKPPQIPANSTKLATS
ncbi:MAG: hypothetical protein KBB52_02535 [Candidatus Omnitrophica bacterium]|nr:hypothetical protein [Candidatus Omnitrophota bacterium]